MDESAFHMLSCVLGIRDIAVNKGLADNTVNRSVICKYLSVMRNAMRKNTLGKEIHSNGVLGYYFK